MVRLRLVQTDEMRNEDIGAARDQQPKDREYILSREFENRTARWATKKKKPNQSRDDSKS